MSDAEKLRLMVRSRDRTARKLAREGRDASGIRALTRRMAHAADRLEAGEPAAVVFADLRKLQVSA